MATCFECGKNKPEAVKCKCGNHVHPACMKGHAKNCVSRHTQIWRIHLKPGGALKEIDSRAFCIERNLLGVGWPVECNATKIDYATYDRLATKRYADEGRGSATNALKYRMALNDLCWTTDRKNYYVGRITGEWEYRAGRQYQSAGIYNIRKCDWVEVGKVHAVPGDVITSFIPRRSVQTVAGNMVRFYSQFKYNNAMRGFQYPIEPLATATIFELLSPEDVEDVFAVWLQTQGYLLIPSSRRVYTPCYEYVLQHRRTGRDAVAQVKKKETLNRDEYDNMGEVYLFTTSGNYIGKRYPQVHCANPEEISSFVLENRSIMPERVRVWLQVWDELSRN